MADVRRGRTAKRKQRSKDERDKPTKEEYAVAKFLKFHPTLNRDGTFFGNNAQYFIGSKAVDALLESKWATKTGKSDAIFLTRPMCEAYCERLREKGFFAQVQKIEKRDKKKKPKTPSESPKAVKDETRSSKKSEKKLRKDKGKDDVEPEKQICEGEKKDSKEKEAKMELATVDKSKDEAVCAEERKRRKKRAKLEVTEIQEFVDGPDMYVWIYDPVPTKTFIIGLLLVLGAIAVCLFPLWPSEVRLGVYYLSIAAACFVGLIIGLCIIRVVLFAIIWALTFGKVSFWLLPNLTEDVGFFDSFRPIYKYDVSTKTPNEQATTETAVEKVDNEGDGNNEQDSLEFALENRENDTEFVQDLENVEKSVDDDEDKDSNDSNASDAEQGSENNDAEDSEARTSASSNNDNGYEMVELPEVENVSSTAAAVIPETNSDEGVVDKNSPSDLRLRKAKKPARKES